MKIGKIFRQNLNLFLFFTAVTLVGIGVVMQISMCNISAENVNYSPLKKRLFMVFMAVVFFIFVLKIRTNFWGKWAWAVYFFSLIGLALCFMPGLGVEVNGAKRWISFAFLGLSEKIQPSEFARIGLIIFLSAWLHKFQARRLEFLKGFFVPATLAGFLVILVLLETDISSAVLMSSVAFVILLAGGVKFRYLLIAGILAGIFGSALIYKNQNRRERVLAFLDIEKHKLERGYQQYQARQALIDGGLRGEGLGNSKYKHRIYGSDTDFIFAIIGSEMGLQMTTAVIVIYMLILMLGFYVQITCTDVYKKLLVLGCVSSITIQAIIHILVNVTFFPNTGMPLPFVSYGGSNLIVSFFTVGIIIKVYSESAIGFAKTYQEAKILRKKFSPSGL